MFLIGHVALELYTYNNYQIMHQKTKSSRLNLSKNLLNRNLNSLRSCNQKRKVPTPNFTRHSAGLRDPTSLQDTRQPSGQKYKNAVISIGCSLSP